MWVSEVMLQQTQAATVAPYFERWMQRFPDIHTLAAVPLEDVLKAWEGLGYYARARNLHRAARAIIAQYAGQIPANPDALLTVPGIGRYTAGAILSLAFGQPVPVLDGNVRRVLCRVDNITTDPRRTPTEQALWERARSLVESAPEGFYGDLNEALMELGAVVCTPRRPDCPRCPLNQLCLAHALGVEEARPVRSPKPRIPEHRAVAGVIVRPEDGRCLLVRRPYDGLLGGLWGFPSTLLSSDGGAHAKQLARALTEQLAIGTDIGDAVAAVKHAYTHFRVTLEALSCSIVRGEPQTGYYPEVAWSNAAEIETLPLAEIDRKIIAQISQNPLEVIR